MCKKTGLKNYPEKLKYLLVKQNFNCIIGKIHGHECNGTELHHRLHNRKENRRRFPLFVNSVFNLWWVSHYWHTMHPSAGKITLMDADEIEMMLSQNSELNEWAQKPETRIPLDILPSVKYIFDLLDEKEEVKVDE